MCPLRLVLIFLSATLAGFFVLRGLKSHQPDLATAADAAGEVSAAGVAPTDPLPLPKKVGSAICCGFWTCVHMASCRYLWRNLATSSSVSEKKH